MFLVNANIEKHLAGNFPYFFYTLHVLLAIVNVNVRQFEEVHLMGLRDYIHFA